MYFRSLFGYLFRLVLSFHVNFNLKVKVKVKSLSPVWLFVILWTVAYQASLSMGFSRQEYWSGLPCPSPKDLPDPGIEPGSPALEADALTSEPCMSFKWDNWLRILFSLCLITKVNKFLLFLFWCCLAAQSCLTLCDPKDCSMPGFPVLHQLPELTQTHVYWISDAPTISSSVISSSFYLQ